MFIPTTIVMSLNVPFENKGRLNYTSKTAFCKLNSHTLRSTRKYVSNHECVLPSR